MKKYQLYGVGAALVDTEVVVSDAFLEQYRIDKGVMTLVDQPRQAELLQALSAEHAHLMHKCGGSACNSTVAAASFGASTFFSGRVADDEDGRHFVSDLTEAGVKFHSVEAESGVTGKCLVMVTDDAERTMNTYLGASENLTEREIDQSALINSEWFYIEGYLLTDDTRAAVIEDAVATAKANGVKVALSLSDPFVAQLFADNLRAVIGDGIDLIFCNKEEALAFTDTENTDDACEILRDYAKTFAITEGAKGAIVFDGKDTPRAQGVAADAVDTNGAGDMFAGAFLYAITSGRSYGWAAELANKSAARVVERFGPRLDTVEFASIRQQFGI
ncbi:MAG: adenosine kinase [Porticoccaceae bacterium]|nr:adenosine kinase [Porticoccaceae bacterium]